VTAKVWYGFFNPKRDFQNRRRPPPTFLFLQYSIVKELISQNMKSPAFHTWLQPDRVSLARLPMGKHKGELLGASGAPPSLLSAL